MDALGQTLVHKEFLHEDLGYGQCLLVPRGKRQGIPSVMVSHYQDISLPAKIRLQEQNVNAHKAPWVPDSEDGPLERLDEAGASSEYIGYKRGSNLRLQPACRASRIGPSPGGKSSWALGGHGCREGNLILFLCVFSGRNSCHFSS